MSYKSLLAYQKGFDLAMDIFHITKRFPKEETFGLTSQIRRSSRSVCSSIAESYRKRRYEAHFISKLTDADMENCETQVWLDFSLKCLYITDNEYINLNQKSIEIGNLLGYMIENPDKFIQKSKSL